MWVKLSSPLWEVTGSPFSFSNFFPSVREDQTLRSIYFLDGTMVMLKISAFLVAYALVICQMYCSQAAPARPVLESMSDRVTLTDYEARRLLNAIVKEFVQMTAEELEQQATEGNSSVTAQKRACNTATCVTHRLADFLSRSGGMGNSNFVPTNVGAKAFGRRRRSVQM
ncbi:calcitonin gene-related peptide 1-like isoform X2 [Sebastes fasciatus]|uniref:calcitonin gene-related peptide 1-like isoform X2 n=2 Tax=Sebastes TaxID=34820 RepID=UPI003D9EA1EC